MCYNVLMPLSPLLFSGAGVIKVVISSEAIHRRSLSRPNRGEGRFNCHMSHKETRAPEQREA